ncbi:alpha/beta hydrolase fold domain-containing protein [Brachybacterium hainanense]|uniref:Alpha/beta hydrolase fold domain-containing protein n=1 Tax=Brachybacterium hainanense TaxID=1541174 RepID=A0ABV6R9Z9_9MICO
MPDWFSTTRYPTVVFVQGSGWRRQELGQRLVPLSQFARRGYVIAIVEHRPSAVAPFPAQLDDARAAVHVLREKAEHYRVDPSRIALWGDSSGGHLVALAAVTDGADDSPGAYADTPLDVRAVVDVYGPSDLARMPEDDACTELLGGVDPVQHPEHAAPAAPVTYIRSAAERSLPPFLLLHGSDDVVVPFEQSVTLGDALAEAGHDVELYRLEGAGHGAGAFFRDPVLDLIDRFLTTHLDA